MKSVKMLKSKLKVWGNDYRNYKIGTTHVTQVKPLMQLIHVAQVEPLT